MRSGECDLLETLRDSTSSDLKIRNRVEIDTRCIRKTKKFLNELKPPNFVFKAIKYTKIDLSLNCSLEKCYLRRVKANQVHKAN
jgi:hypothetical protein